jgi:hypothetical protein
VSKEHFLQKLGEIFGDTTPPSKAEVEREEAEELRARNLTRVKPAITVDDVTAIVRDTLTEHPALRTVRLWYDTARGARPSRDGRPMRFLVLLGQTGRGKTVAASCVLAERGGYYISAPELHRLATSRRPDARARVVEMHLGVVVVLDDLGTEDADASMEACVWDLINARQTERKMTILTGNMTRAEFEQRYGERTTRRIEHQGAIVEIQGEDLRRRAL